MAHNSSIYREINSWPKCSSLYHQVGLLVEHSEHPCLLRRCPRRPVGAIEKFGQSSPLGIEDLRLLCFLATIYAVGMDTFKQLYCTPNASRKTVGFVKKPVVSVLAFLFSARSESLFASQCTSLQSSLLYNLLHKSKLSASGTHGNEFTQSFPHVPASSKRSPWTSRCKQSTVPYVP